MYVVVRRYTVAGSSEELIRWGKEEFLPIFKGLPGFRGLHVADSGGRAVISISLWDSKIAARRASKMASEWVSKSAIGLAPFPPDILEGDTVVDIP